MNLIKVVLICVVMTYSALLQAQSRINNILVCKYKIKNKKNLSSKLIIHKKNISTSDTILLTIFRYGRNFQKLLILNIRVVYLYIVLIKNTMIFYQITSTVVLMILIVKFLQIQ
jgi:hypothetical protein